MNKRTHRVLVALTGSLSSIAALLSATDTSALGVSPQSAAWAAFVLAAAGVVVTSVRQAWEKP